MSEKNNAIFTRRSIRKYEITPIPKEIIEEVIKAAPGCPARQKPTAVEISCIQWKRKKGDT